MTRWTYDAYGNPASKTDARGHVTLYEYDAATSAFPARITLPRTGAVSHVWAVPEFDYRTGRARVLEDANGNRTLYAYDALGRLVQADFADGGRTTHAYVETTLPVYVRTSVHDGSASPITSFTYFDGLGRRIQTTAAGEKGRPIYTRWFYDELGRNFLHEGPYFAGDGDYPWARTEFDLWDRPVSVRRADGEHGSVATRYSYSGLSATETDPDGAAKTITRDYLERVLRLVEHADQGEVATAFDYNAAGDLLRITNHAGVATRFERDTLGRPRSISDPDMGAWQYTWDANGNLKTQTDAMGRTVALEYDPLNRVVLRFYSAPNPPVTYTYDNLAVPNGVGRPHTVSGAQATIAYDAYDEMGRVLADTRTFAGNPARYTTRMEYDPAGNLTAVVYPMDGYRVDYAYHPGTRLLERVGGPDGVEFAELEDYTAEGKPGFLYQGNGTSTSFGHDRRSGRLKTIRTQAPSLEPADDIFHQVYSHTPGGDIREIADRVRSKTRRYAYDRLHRLVSETSPEAVLVHPSKVVRLKYDYEGSGPFHAPKKIELGGLTHGLHYDANGNLVDGPALSDPQKVTRRAVGYTADNMPARIDQPGALCPEGPAGAGCPDRVEFGYDGENRRAVKRSAAGTTHYVGRHFEVRNGSPVRYVFAGDLRLARVGTDGVRHFHKDHLMSTVAVTDEAGVKVESSGYIPFGQPRNRTGTPAAAFRYTDQELDVETGLYNYKARLYDPLTAVFNTPDPFLSANLVFAGIGGTGGSRQDGYAAGGGKAGSSAKAFETRQLISFFGKTSQRLNRFAYVQNSPVNYVDSDGLWPKRHHNEIIGMAFRVPDGSLKSQIERGSAAADSWKFQGPSYTHMHAMREKGESVESAKGKNAAIRQRPFERVPASFSSRPD